MAIGKRRLIHGDPLFPGNRLVSHPKYRGDQGGCILAIFAFFPTEPSPEPCKSQRILLRPQEHYVVAWSVAEDKPGDAVQGQKHSGRRSPPWMSLRFQIAIEGERGVFGSDGRPRWFKS